MQETKQILIKYWGYSNFRPKQESIIQSVLNGNDTLALLPTGGGKSICYQVPGLLLDGITIIITPLIALMKDQVDNLRKRNIKAVALYSGMRKSEYDLAINQCTHGDTKFLYLSPERLISHNFLTVLLNLNVKLIAVDEAHCISQWGYDFRPPYLKIAEIRPYFPKVPILALTATATPDVVLDIQEKLAFKKNNLIKNSFERKNLVYYISKEENKLEILLRLVNKQKGTGIVYVRNRKKTKEIADFLVQQKISASYYHAGLDSRIRDERQKQWKEGFIRVIVATNAFGMGIDKDNVRFVVHLDLPDNPEAYFQEAGRAGRDGEKAFSVILWENADILNLKRNFELSYPPLETIKNIYQALASYFKLTRGSGEGQTFNFDIVDFSKQYNQNPLVVFNSLKFIENQGLILMSEAIHKPSKLKIILPGNELYKFQVEQPSFDNLIKYLLRTYSGLFQEFVNINEIHLMNTFNISKEQLLVLLRRLEKLEVIEYLPENNKPQITFTSEILAANDMYISKEVYENRKLNAEKRMKAILYYVESDHKCRSQSLLSYFGENTTKRCGFCDICLERNKTHLSELEFDHLVEQIKPLIKEKPMMIDDLIFFVETNDVDKLINAIQWLQDNGKIKEDENHRLYWV